MRAGTGPWWGSPRVRGKVAQLASARPGTTLRRRLAVVQRWRGQDEIPTDWGRCVLTIGVFDGLHRGHAELIAHAVKSGSARGVPTVLMTFDPHPMEVVFPGSHPAQLTTLTRRAQLAEEFGIDVFLVMPFTTDFMKLTPERYVHELLVENLHVVEVVVGENFTFGKRLEAPSTRCAAPALGSGSRWNRCRWCPSTTTPRP